MASVVIGVDPHKGSHTAVVIDQSEVVLGQVRVRACAAQAERLLAWAAVWPQRTWALEGAGGVGHLLAQQLVTAGERVLDVQPGSGGDVRDDPVGKAVMNSATRIRSTFRSRGQRVGPRAGQRWPR
jgi:transposase